MNIATFGQRPFFGCHDARSFSGQGDGFGDVMNQNAKKSRQSWLARLLFGFALVVAGSQAWGLNCEGTIYFKAPDSWTAVYLLGGGMFVEGSIGTSGWYEFSAAKVAQGSNFMLSGNGEYYPWIGVDRKNYNTSGQQPNGVDFTCDDFNSTTSLYIYEDPTAEGKTAMSNEPPDAKYFYFLPPDDQLWNSSVPMISFDGGQTGVAMSADASRCGWFYYVWFNQAIPTSVTIYRDSDTDREEVIGYDGYDGAGTAPTAIPMADVFTALGSSTAYFISDASMWPETMDDASKGFSALDPAVDGSCSYSLAAIIYDTDAALHPAFSCYCGDYCRDSCQMGAQGVSRETALAAVTACIGVTTGIVQDTLGPDKKPLLKTAAMGGKGETCFISEAFFNQLFNATPAVNEMSCFDLPFSRNSSGKWEFDSDNYQSPGATVPGGFYPAESTTDYDILKDYGSTPVLQARKKRTAEGPIFYGPELRELDATEGVPKIDLLCNGPGWDGGVDCEGYFADGDGTDALFKEVYGTSLSCGFGWSCPEKAPAGWPKYKDGSEIASSSGGPRWTGERNQMFCFESHAQFAYKPGLKFNFRGDDDIWVFLGGKLAVDLGGTHLAAPAYVDLSKLTDKNGQPFVEGETYDLDIFFCDRRTTMSNVRINTNMYIQQTQSVEKKVDTTYTGTGSAYQICYNETGSGDCAAALSGASISQEITYCTKDELEKAGIKVTYVLYKGSKVYENSSTVFDSTWFSAQYAAGTTTFFGGFNVENWYRPIFTKEAMSGLPSGSYRIVPYANGKGSKTQSFTFRIAGSLDVLNADGKDSTEHIYKVKTAALAGARIPVYIGAIGEKREDGYLDVDLEGAVGEKYSITFTDGLLVYADSNGTTPLTSSDRLEVGASGIDTVWVTIPLSAMTASSMSGSISVRKNQLDLSFYLPVLVFTDSTYTNVLAAYGNVDISSDRTLYRGAAYTAYVAMLDPTTQYVCTECSYGLEIYPASDGVTGRSELGIVNGTGMVNFRSSKLYPDAKSGIADSAFFTVTTQENSLISVTYSGLVFTEPPVPIPQEVLVFDARGKAETYAGLYSGLARDEYLDGIADSLYIVYHRPFPKDSLPDSIVVNWAIDSTENVVISKAEIEKVVRPFNDTLYDSVLAFGGLELSAKTQTAGSGKLLVSWARYKKNGVETSDPFSQDFTDKVAPIITRASTSEISDGIFRVAISLSEPVRVDSTADVRSLFGYYLRSATDLAEGMEKYKSVPAINANRTDSSITMTFNLGSGAIPQSGDYARALPVGILDLNGNAMTDYNATVPSPWILIEGEAASTIASIKMGEVNPDSLFDSQNRNIFSQVIGIYDSIGVISERYPHTVGYLIRSDMGNMLMDSLLDAKIASGDVKLQDVKLHYELNIFTNLGTFVAKRSETISCADSLFGGDCRNNRGYVYVGWNMVTDKGRVAGTGAYIAKLNTYVKLPIRGKTAKHNVTETWGVRRVRSK